MGHVPRQWSQTHKQIYKWMDKKEKNKDVAIVQPKSRSQSDWNAMQDLQKNVYKQMSENLNEL